MTTPTYTLIVRHEENEYSVIGLDEKFTVITGGRAMAPTMALDIAELPRVGGDEGGHQSFRMKNNQGMDVSLNSQLVGFVAGVVDKLGMKIQDPDAVPPPRPTAPCPPPKTVVSPEMKKQMDEVMRDLDRAEKEFDAENHGPWDPVPPTPRKGFVEDLEDGTRIVRDVVRIHLSDVKVLDIFRSQEFQGDNPGMFDSKCEMRLGIGDGGSGRKFKVGWDEVDAVLEALRCGGEFSLFLEEKWE